MARSRPPDRFDHVIGAATRIFVSRGYRRAQMSDVAELASLSVGALYHYVESKEALFYACLAAASPSPHRPILQPVVAGPTDEQVRKLVDEGVTAVSAAGALRAALRHDKPADVAAELAGVIADMYDRTAASRTFQAILEAAAVDRPELFDAFFSRLRRPALDGLARYLQRRIDSGHLRPVINVANTARLINETQAWFARHRHGDADTADVDDSTARATVIDTLVASLIPQTKPTNGAPSTGLPASPRAHDQQTHRGALHPGKASVAR